MKLYEALAKAFQEEGVDTLFTLMGDANMHWCTAMSHLGVRLVHARHEAAAVAMAEGYAQVARTVGVASVTSGPGTSQIATSLTAAVRGRVPVVVFAGDTPRGARYHLQQFDVQSFVASTGARLVRMRDVDNALEAVHQAFTIARHERTAVVFSPPYDLQDAEYPWDFLYRPSTELAIPPQAIHPDPAMVRAAADVIARAERPVVLVGRGAVRSEGARDAILGLAERAGAVMATSIKAKSWFEGEPFDAGIAGSFASTTARTVFAEADLVIGIGAGMGHFTMEAGYLFPEATILQVDVDPRPVHEAVPIADVAIRGDAGATARALNEELDQRGVRLTGLRTPELRDALAAARPSEPRVDMEPGVVDPRDAMRAIDRAIPKDWAVVIGAGHMWNFAVEYLTGRHPSSLLYTIDFGPVGQAIGVAIGAAAAGGAPGVALIDGDGGLLMHVQELETIGRHGIPVKIFCLNDGAYSAEVHKLVARGIDEREAIYGAPDFVAVAGAFGVAGTRIDDTTADLDATIAPGIGSDAAHVFDVRISYRVPSAQFRRLHFGEAP
jgi:acetolactate synthase I/II/III large subunit